MQKKVLMVLSLIVVGVTLFASPIAFGLDSTFTLDDLFSDGFVLRSDGEDIIVTPPKSKIGPFEENIEIFMLTCPVDFDDWVFATLKFKSGTDYERIYSFVSKNYGEGLNKENVEFFAEHYSSDFSEEMIMAKMLSGELDDYMTKAIVAEMLGEMLSDESVNDINMWKTDSLYIFVADSSSYGGPIVIFFRTSLIKEYIDDFIDLALTSMMYE